MGTQQFDQQGDKIKKGSAVSTKDLPLWQKRGKLGIRKKKKKRFGYKHRHYVKKTQPKICQKKSPFFSGGANRQLSCNLLERSM